MLPSKLTKSAKLGIALQLTEVIPSTAPGRLWEVHDVERNRGFRVTWKGASEGLAEEDVEGAIGMAIERALVSPPEKMPGPLYEVIVDKDDLGEYIRARKSKR